MGNAGASTKHVDLSALVAATSLKESELRDLLRQFRRGAGSSSSSALGVGVLTPVRWRELCASQCGLDDERLQRILFRLLDFDHDGALSFEDCAKALSVLTHGSAQDKLSMCVKALDGDGDGSVSRADLVDALEAVLAVLRADPTASSFSNAQSNANAHGGGSGAVLEAQGGAVFRSADAYADHLLSELGAREGATALSVSAYERGAWRSVDVFLAAQLAPLTDVDD